MKSAKRLAPLTAAITARVPALGLGRTSERWPALLGLFTAFSAVATSIYFSAGLGAWSPSLELSPRCLGLVVGFFFLPSLAEELLWRWTLISPQSFHSRRAAAVSILFSTAAFTAAHPVVAALFLPHARELFTHSAFLLIVFLLGLTCGASYIVSRSIWPPVVMHWATVLVWKFLLGGPFVLLGR